MPPRVRLYRRGVLEADDFPLADISDRLAEPDTTVWLDVCAPDHADIAVLAEEFGLHHLAIEDALHEHQRPKLDRYESHLFLSAYQARIIETTSELATSEISVFVTRQALITVRKDDRFDIARVVAHWDESADLAKHGVGFLLWGLLDYIVDGHFAAVQELDDCIEPLKTYSSMTDPSTKMSNAEASSCAKAWFNCGESCCPCVKSSML